MITTLTIPNPSPAFWGITAGILYAISVVPYFIDIFHGQTRPNRTTYAIWSIVKIVLITSYISSGATNTIWYGLFGATVAITLLIISIKHGMGGFSKFDIACFLLAILAIALWVTTEIGRAHV